MADIPVVGAVTIQDQPQQSEQLDNDNNVKYIVGSTGSHVSTGSKDTTRTTTSATDDDDDDDDNDDNVERIKQNSIYYPRWHNIVSGAVAGAGSRAVTAPLDLIRIRRQLYVVTYPTPSLIEQMRTIIRTEGGISGLYRGNMAAMYLWISYASVQFTIYNTIKDSIHHYQQQQQQLQQQQQQQQQLLQQSVFSLLAYQLSSSPTAISFLSGAGAGLCATLATYPFDVCRTTFAARPRSTSTISTTTISTTSTNTSNINDSIHRPPRTMIEFVQQLYQTKGMRGFYAGSFPAMIQIVPYMGLNFTIYDWLTTSTSSTTSTTSVMFSAYAGSISGSVSKILIYPIDTIKRRLQAQAFFGGTSTSSSSRKAEHVIADTITNYATTNHHNYNNNHAINNLMMNSSTNYKGMIDCFYKIVTTEGIKSLYRGIVPSVLKTAISTALTFALYRFTKNVLENVHDTIHSSSSNITTTTIITDNNDNNSTDNDNSSTDNDNTTTRSASNKSGMDTTKCEKDAPSQTSSLKYR